MTRPARCGARDPGSTFTCDRAPGDAGHTAGDGYPLDHAALGLHSAWVWLWPREDVAS